MIQCHFEISGIRKDGGYDSGLNHGDIAIMCPLERVFFWKYVPHRYFQGGDCLKSKSTPSEDWKFVVSPVVGYRLFNSRRDFSDSLGGGTCFHCKQWRRVVFRICESWSYEYSRRGHRNPPLPVHATPVPHRWPCPVRSDPLRSTHISPNNQRLSGKSSPHSSPAQTLHTPVP